MTPSSIPLERHRHRSAQRRLIAASVVIAVAASACSSDDAGATPETADATATSATTDATVATDTTGQTTLAAGADDEEVMSIDDEGATSINEEQLAAELDDIALATISAVDRDGLIFMREEEKLALDVYQALYNVWGLRIFENIAGAEQTHTDSVRTLLDRYDIADPAFDQPAGVFSNPDLQALYDELVTRGSESTTEALLVGALIEDLDIADLQARASDQAAIALVYANLEKGSRNHLRAFIGQLDRAGTTYTPSHISQADFDAIIASPTERGNGK